MGRIKSALEIALERTESVKSDKSGVEQFETRQRGKRLANEYLENPKEVSLGDAIKKAPKEQQAALKQGVFDVLISQISLPASPEDEERLAAAGKGLELVIGDGRFTALFKQLSQALSRYMDEAARYEEAIRRQYAPKLRQKEEEIARRIGRPIQLDPFQDPEFTAFYNQQMNALKGNYEAAISQVKEQAVRMFESR
ncbi:MAG: hypothetical protein LBD08_03635 [Treponema sp.]|jgi:hypothetical protein|nr:hypothetical protein [Treponema sp.]